MALEKTTAIVQIEIMENGIIQVKEQTRILEDGEVISSQNHRYTIAPNEQPPQGASARLIAICNLMHDKETKDAYKAHLAKLVI